MIWCRSNALAKANIGDEAQVTIRDAQLAFLSFQKNLLHRHQVASHFPAEFPSLQASFRLLAPHRIGRLGDAHNASANTISPPATADDEVRAD